MKSGVIILERLFAAPIAQVWLALTQKELMKQWYFDLPEFKAELGFKFQFTGGPPEREYLHLCEVTEAIPEKKLTYSWRYDGYEGNSFVSFELFEKGDQTLLKLTHTGLDTFPKNNPDLDIKNFRMGWDQIINISLKDFLEPENKS